MTRFLAPIVLVALLGVIHAQMWFGPGGIPKVAQLQKELAQQQLDNAHARIENDQLASEVDDLEHGLGMVEEKARMELGMVKPNEIFVQVMPQGSKDAASAPPVTAAASSTSGTARQDTPAPR